MIIFAPIGAAIAVALAGLGPLAAGAAGAAAAAPAITGAGAVVGAAALPALGSTAAAAADPNVRQGVEASANQTHNNVMGSVGEVAHGVNEMNLPGINIPVHRP